MYLIEINNNNYLSKDEKWYGKFKSLAKVFDDEESAILVMKRLEKENKNLVFRVIKK